MSMVESQHVIRLPLLRMQVVELLRSAIIAGDFEPGERLVEAPLCKRFGVSRSVIREAIRQLEVEGLVAILANRGPVITTLTVDEAHSLYEVRAALEGLVGSLFTRRAGVSQRERLRSALAEVASAYKHGDLIAKLAAKDRFYGVLIDGADNSTARLTLRGIHARVQILRRLSLQVDGREKESFKELEAIVDAVERRDAGAARAACEHHVEQAAVGAIAMLRQSRATQPQLSATEIENTR